MLGINRGIISKICEEREGERGNSIRISQSEIVSRAKATERVGGKRKGEFLSAIGRNKRIARICFPEYFAARDGDERLPRINGLIPLFRTANHSVRGDRHTVETSTRDDQEGRETFTANSPRRKSAPNFRRTATLFPSSSLLARGTTGLSRTKRTRANCRPSSSRRPSKPLPSSKLSHQSPSSGNRDHLQFSGKRIESEWSRRGIEINDEPMACAINREARKFNAITRWTNRGGAPDTKFRSIYGYKLSRTRELLDREGLSAISVR